VYSVVLANSTRESSVVAFKAQSGGLTLVFKAKVLRNQLDPSVCECSFAFPETIRQTQLRQAARINLTNQPEVSVTLFLETRMKFDGRVTNISATGAKIQLLGDLSDKFKSSQIIEDC
jgi:c-di-GMP-binding flagellar brake protein YcgR